MKQRQRILKISKNRIFYTPENSVGLDQTSLPTGDIRFRESADIYWKAELLHFDKAEKSLLVKIIDYHPEDTSSFAGQKAKDTIHLIYFEKLNWAELEPLLSVYKKSALSPSIYEPAEPEKSTGVQKEDKQKKQGRRKYSDLIQGTAFQQKIPHEDPESSPEDESGEVIHQPLFTFKFKDAEFRLGYVSVKKRFAFADEEIEFKIYNSEIIPEYDYIKSFFPKAFGGSRTFSVEAEVTVKNGKVLNKKAESFEIGRINEELIDSIKIRRTLLIPKAEMYPGIDKSLFTADEVFDNVNDKDLDGNVFKQKAEDILHTILEEKKVRNRKQLEYLAGYKHSPNTKIRFTLRPLFGFLFFIEGDEMNHFCWELLNSHATYLWSIDKSDNLYTQFKRIEDTINIIRDSGRKAYKHAYRQNEIDSDILFNVVIHDNINSPLVDGFVKWKHRLKEKLV